MFFGEMHRFIVVLYVLVCVVRLFVYLFIEYNDGSCCTHLSDSHGPHSDIPGKTRSLLRIFSRMRLFFCSTRTPDLSLSSSMDTEMIVYANFDFSFDDLDEFRP